MADGETLEELYQEVKEHIDMRLEVNAEREMSVTITNMDVVNNHL